MIIYTGTGDTDREVDERERWVKTEKHHSKHDERHQRLINES
jgi:hypothetical protein